MGTEDWWEEVDLSFDLGREFLAQFVASLGGSRPCREHAWTTDDGLYGGGWSTSPCHQDLV